MLTGHADAVLAASIFHYGEFTVQQAKQHMASCGIPMRLFSETAEMHTRSSAPRRAGRRCKCSP